LTFQGRALPDEGAWVDEDNVVFRAGFARTIPAARQLVNHGHVLVDGRRVDIPSFRVDRGQSVSIDERSKNLPPVVLGLASSDAFQTAWLNVDNEARQAVVASLPDETSILFPIEIQLVVEFYSQML
jgi:small subunit ribosomal protein S4